MASSSDLLWVAPQNVAGEKIDGRQRAVGRISLASIAIQNRLSMAEAHLRKICQLCL
jgi:hypothetical protein